MSPPDSILAVQTAALLSRLARERDVRVHKLRDEAALQASEIVQRARTESRQRVHQAVVEARREIANGVALRRAALETSSRRSRQSTLRAILERAWQRLPAALEQRWQDATARAEWCQAASAQAMQSLRDTRNLQVELDASTAAALSASLVRGLRALGADAVTVHLVPALGAGLRIRGGDACLDATIAGLLAARDRVAAELLADFDVADAGVNARARLSKCVADPAEAVT